MRKTIASISVFILVVSLLLTSCGKKRTFEPSGVTGEKAETAKSQRGEIKLEPDKFTFYGVQMGMTTDQVQISVGKAAQVYARNDKMFLTEDVKVNEFKNGLDRVVYYISIQTISLSRCSMWYPRPTEFHIRTPSLSSAASTVQTE